jgi:hypothetical protein
VDSNNRTTVGDLLGGFQQITNASGGRVVGATEPLSVGWRLDRLVSNQLPVGVLADRALQPLPTVTL